MNLFGCRKNSASPPKTQLYAPQECTKANGKKKVWLRSYLLHKEAPAVLLCPGGSYQFVSCHNEGDPIARKLNSLGYHAFVLNYRVAGKARFPAPMEDVARAIQFIKHQAESFHVKTERVILLGSSAGGHLCAYFAARYSEFERPDQGTIYSLRPYAVVLSYPVINLAEDTHAESRDTLLGRGSPLHERLDKSADLLVTPDYPPTFLWHCEDDRCVPISNSIRMAAALKRHGVRHTFLSYPTGGHGLGLATGHPAETWFRQAVAFLEEIQEKDF